MNPPDYRQYDEVTPDFVRLTNELDEELFARQGEAQRSYHGFNRLDDIAHVVLAYVIDPFGNRLEFLESVVNRPQGEAE